jgi:hypothetical protein
VAGVPGLGAGGAALAGGMAAIGIGGAAAAGAAAPAIELVTPDGGVADVTAASSPHAAKLPRAGAAASALNRLRSSRRLRSSFSMTLSVA